jgi:hypothetical protein
VTNCEKLKAYIEGLGQKGVTVEYDPQADLGRSSGYLAGVDGHPPCDYLGWNLQVAQETAERYYKPKSLAPTP